MVLDIAFDIDQINSELKQQLDVVATTYGMSVGEFTDQLRQDKEDEAALREARIQEEEKAALSVSIRQYPNLEDNLMSEYDWVAG